MLDFNFHLIHGLLGPLKPIFKDFSRTQSLFKGFSRLTSNSRAFQGSETCVKLIILAS
jgi:hypothetical protein